MTPYIVHIGCVTEKHLAELRRLDAFLDALPERLDVMSRVDERRDESHWSCHVLARAFAISDPTVGWIVTDGFFLRVGTEHSWLRMPTDGSRDVVLLDVLPVAGVRPMMVDGGRHSPWFPAYIQSDAAWTSAETDRWDVEAEALLAAMSKIGSE